MKGAGDHTCLRTTRRTGGMGRVHGVGLVGVGEENRALAQVLARAREGGFDARRTDRCAQPRSADATPAGRGARGAAEADS